MCTRVLWSDNDLAVLAGRSMDWPESTEPLVVAFPRGRERDGGAVAGQTVVAQNPLRWTSRYRSLATTVYGIGTVDGLNERGFAAHGLYLQETDFGVRDPSRPGLHAGLWVQYLLDRAASVGEALELLDGIQIVMVTARGHDATIHLALEDVSGDSAVIEFDHGRQVVHHGREFTLMTNDPPYNQQLELLSRQDFSHPSRDMPLPGNVNAVDRFQRAAYYSALMPKPETERQAVASVMAVMRNVSVPFGAPYGEIRCLQHRVPDGHGLDQSAVLLRAHHEPERHLGRLRHARSSRRRRPAGDRSLRRDADRQRHVAVRAPPGPILNRSRE